MTPRRSFLATTIVALCAGCGSAAMDDGVTGVDDGVPGGATPLSQASAPFAVTSVVAAGSGCPAGSVDAIAHAPGGAQRLTLLFESFNANGSARVGTRAVGESRACQFTVELTPQPGYQIALDRVQMRGSVDVFGPRDTRRGINNVAKISRELFFNDATNSGFTFPFLDRYLVNSSSTYTIEEDTRGQISYAQCNARVSVRARLGLAVTGANNYADIGGIDQNGALDFNLLTRACTGNQPPGTGIIPISGDQATVKNACVLRGVGTSSRTEVCYGPNGEILSTRPDPDV